MEQIHYTPKAVLPFSMYKNIKKIAGNLGHQWIAVADQAEAMSDGLNGVYHPIIEKLQALAWEKSNLPGWTKTGIMSPNIVADEDGRTYYRHTTDTGRFVIEINERGSVTVEMHRPQGRAFTFVLDPDIQIHRVSFPYENAATIHQRHLDEFARHILRAFFERDDPRREAIYQEILAHVIDDPHPPVVDTPTEPSVPPAEPRPARSLRHAQ